MNLSNQRNHWPPGVRLLYIHQGDAKRGEAFFATRHAEAATSTDLGGLLAQGFGLDRGSLSQLFGAAVWKRGLRAWRAGHRVGRPAGDVRLMPGAFLLQGPRILWAKRGTHAGDHADWNELAAALDEHLGLDLPREPERASEGDRSPRLRTGRRV